MAHPADLSAALSELLEQVPAVQELRRELDDLKQRVKVLEAGDPEELVDSVKAARVLGMTVVAVRIAAYRGRIPSRRLGRRLRFRLGDLFALGR